MQPDEKPFNPIQGQDSSIIPPPDIPQPPTDGPAIVVSGDIQISDVSKSLWAYVKQTKRLQLMGFIAGGVLWEILLAVVFIVSIMHPHSGGRSSFGLAELVFVPIAGFGCWMAWMRNKFEDAFLEQFAAANGYGFQKFGVVDKTYGTLFRLSDDARVSDIIDGSYQGYNLRLFLYEVTVGSGKSQQTYQETVFELNLQGILPHLLLIDKKTRLGQLNFAGAFGEKNTIQLEGDFNDRFTLYAPPGQQIEALEVFSPDTMALTEDSSTHYTIEFINNRIYMYAPGFIGNADQLTSAFSLAKQLIAKLAPLASRLEDDGQPLTVEPTNIDAIPIQKASAIATVLTSTFIVLVGICIGVIAIFSSSNTTSTTPAASQNNSSTDTPAPVTVNREGNVLVPRYGVPAAPDELQAAQKTSDAWLKDVQNDDFDAAFKLELPHAQGADYYRQQLELNHKHWIEPNAQDSVIADTSGLSYDTKVPEVVIEYKVVTPALTYYVSIILQNVNGTWLENGTSLDTEQFALTLP